MYNLLYIKEMNNKDLLYSTGNYTQYIVIICKVEESEKEYVCVCITASLCTSETNTTL